VRLPLIALVVFLSARAEADEIILGQSAAFTGSAGALGIEFWRGMEARVRELNDAGGVNGHTFAIIPCDDAYDPEKASKCAVDLISKSKAFVLANTVGTPTFVRIAPFLQHWAKDDIVVFGNFGGAQPQRTMPFAKYVFNLRASYRREGEAQLEICAKAGRNRIGTFMQNDVNGKDLEDGLRQALAKRGQRLVQSTVYERGASVDTDMSAQAEYLKNSQADCVVSLGSYSALAAFVRAARAKGLHAPLLAISFAGAEPLAKSLPDGAPDGLIMTQVVPSYNDTSLPLVRAYRAAMDKYKPTKPAGIVSDYQPSGYSYGSLESYISTTVLADVVAKATPLTRASFRSAAESLKDRDIGLGADHITFGPVTGPDTALAHEGLSRVWITVLRNGAWTSVDNPAEAAKQIPK
jgi:branched-chain amino acid transport system substrate-binding protein